MNEQINKYKDLGYFIALIDGLQSKDISSFLFEIGKAFNFPHYYGRNMNALSECINDLSWIKEKNYLLVINNSQYFLGNESLDTQQEMWDFLKNVRAEWASVPNYKGEDQYRDKADFVIITDSLLPNN